MIRFSEKLGLLLFATCFSSFIYSQCEVYASANTLEIYCGESVELSAFGQSSGTVVLSEDFNTGGFGSGWNSTPGATSFTNPCSPAGVDGTTHAWMDDNTSVPRTLESASYDLTAATAGVTICFDLLFASQGGATPCEGPDEPDEGVYLEYSIDGGTTWVTIDYFDPNGGNDPMLTNWNNWCFQIPAAAITGNTMFRWHQTADSGADYDHWGIDNVEIYQNDVNAELEWLHDGYSYGVGNSGGPNPNLVSPTSTTTYTAQLTTGTGNVCTNDVTVVVLDPNFDVNLTSTPDPICQGDCAQINGNADVIYDPGGPTTYENNEEAFIFGSPAIPFLNPVGDVSSDMNINVTGINQTNVTNGLITSVCINQYGILALLGGSVDLSNLEIILECPDGTTINLVNVGDLNGNTISNLCFELGAPPISTGTAPYSGTFAPAQSWAGLNGCSANGVWNMTIQGDHNDLDLPVGGLNGWLINFDNPPDIQTPTYNWTPTTDLSDPTIYNPEACPTTTTTYTLEVGNGVPGCLTHSEDITITVDPCTGCTPPVLNLDPITVCAPNDADLNDAINASSDPATTTFYNSQVDAQNATNPIGNMVGASGTYWVRAEEPADPTCFLEYQIDVTVVTVSYSVNIVDENCGGADGEIDLTASGGDAPYTYSIDNGTTTQATALFTGLTTGTYDIVVVDDNGCEATGTVVVNSIGGPSIDAVAIQDPTCAGDCDGEISLTVSGGTSPYVYQWADNLGNPIGGNNATITGLCAGVYGVAVTDAAGICFTTETATLTDPALEDPSFTLTNFCEGAPNNANITGDAGGTLTFNPVPTDGATIDGTTGEISNGVNGATYTVEYTTGGACPETSTETVSVTGFTFNSNTVDENCGNADGEIELIPNGGVAPYNYSIDNGATTQASEIFTALDAGVYDIVIIDDNGCESNGQVSVANVGGPSIDQLIVQDPSCDGACDGEITVVASGGTPPYTYDWFDNAGNPIGTGTDVITGLCAGDYSVEVNDVSGAGLCPVNSNTTLTDPPIEDASFTLGDFCEGAVNNANGIANPGGIFTFNPVPTDGATIDPTTGEISNSVGGTTYSVEYETPGACPETSIETVDVLPGPIFNLSHNDPTCGNDDGEIILDGLDPTTTYDITYDDGTVVGPLTLTSNGAGEIVIDNLPVGAYTDFVVSFNGCTTSDNSIIDLIETGAPNISAPADIVICIGNDVILTANNPEGATISWNNGITDGTAFTPNTVGTTIYTVTGDLNSCTASDELEVEVLPLPNVDAGADQTICEGETVTLSGGGAQNYVWDNGVNDGVAFSPNTTNTYAVIGTDANGCLNTDEVIITVEPNPEPSFEANELFGCIPHEVTFTNTTVLPGVNCTWDFGDGSQATGCGEVDHTYTSVDDFDVTLTIESASGCEESLTLTNYIETYSPPIANFTADPQVTDINNPQVHFTNESTGGIDFTWNFGDNSEGASSYDAIHDYPDDEGGSYTATLITSNGEDCADTARLVIKVDDVILFYVPNTFTPDNDPFNPTFLPVFTSGFDPQDYELLIFNRWGEVIFESHNTEVGWNGTYADFGLVKEGTYIWTIEFKETMSDKRHYHQGHVNILR